MQAAFNILEDNPFSDEAVFAALALVSKSSDFEDFRARKWDLFQAIGAVFFKRILSTDGMQALGLNFLSLFCEDPRCVEEIRRVCADALLQACDHALVTKDEKALDDAMRCLQGLGSLAGTSRFLLDVLESLELDDKIKAKAAATFGMTQDQFLSSKDEARGVKLLKAVPTFFSDLANGIAVRWSDEPTPDLLPEKNATANYSKMQHATDASNMVRDVLTTKNVDSKRRRAAIRLAAVCIGWYGDLLRSIPMLLPTVTSVASIELRVGLARVASALMATNDPSVKADSAWKEDELEALCSAAHILDRVAAWLSFSAGEITDDRIISAALDALTASSQTACQFMLDTAKKESKADKDVTRLKTVLLCAISSCLMLFWMDDPVMGRGLLEIAQRSGFTRACGIMVRDADSSAIHFLFPFLNQLPAETWVQSICVDHSMPLKLICEEWTRAVQARLWSRIYFSGMVLVRVMAEIADTIDLVRGHIQVQVLDVAIASSRETHADKVELHCVMGSLLLLDIFVCQREQPQRRSKELIKQYLEECDRLLKDHLKYDGPDDVGSGDFAELGSKLGWADLRKVCELVRLECL